MSETESATEQITTLPQLETIDRMMKLPVVDAAWSQGQDVYGKVKNANALFNWAFTTTEGVIQRTAVVAAPYVHKLDVPIQLVDQTLVKGIVKLETKAPIIKERPQKIYQKTKTRVMETVQPHLDLMYALGAAGREKATTLKEMSVQKANEVLSTQYGTKAVNGIDTTSALAEKLLDYCFPPSDKDAVADSAPISAAENPLLHTIQTVGQLSNKISRRVYNVVVRQVQQLRKHEVQDYVNALIAILSFTQYLKPKQNAAVTEDEKKQ